MAEGRGRDSKEAKEMKEGGRERRQNEREREREREKAEEGRKK